MSSGLSCQGIMLKMSTSSRHHPRDSGLKSESFSHPSLILELGCWQRYVVLVGGFIILRIRMLHPGIILEIRRQGPRDKCQSWPVPGSAYFIVSVFGSHHPSVILCWTTAYMLLCQTCAAVRCKSTIIGNIILASSHPAHA